MLPIDIALVVVDSGNPDLGSVRWYNYLDGQDYINSITYEDINDVSQATLNTYDLVLSGGTQISADFAKLKGLSVPAVFCNADFKDELKFGTGDTNDASETQIDISDNTHYITD